MPPRRRHLSLVPIAPGAADVASAPAASVAFVAGSNPLALRPDLASAAKGYVESAEAPNTRRAREADLRVFSAWCEAHGASILPASPETVIAFLTDMSKGSDTAAPRAVATVDRYARSIASAHRLQDLPSPTDHAGVKMILRGIRRERGSQHDKKTAVTADVLTSILEPSSELADAPEEIGLRFIRDRAILLFGLATAMRRSEIAALDVKDLTWSDRGVVVSIRKSKTDQDGRGRRATLPRLGPEDVDYCPVRALEAWLLASGIHTGPLFRAFWKGGAIRLGRMGDRQIAEVVKRAVAAAGGRFNPERFAAHSLRSGYVTTAREAGLDWSTIMEQTGHRRIETVRGYSQFTPEAHAATRAEEVFRGIAKKRDK